MSLLLAITLVYLGAPVRSVATLADSVGLYWSVTSLFGRLADTHIIIMCTSRAGLEFRIY